MSLVPAITHLLGIRQEVEQIRANVFYSTVFFNFFLERFFTYIVNTSHDSRLLHIQCLFIELAKHSLQRTLPTIIWQTAAGFPPPCVWGKVTRNSLPGPRRLAFLRKLEAVIM